MKTLYSLCILLLLASCKDTKHVTSSAEITFDDLSRHMGGNHKDLIEAYGQSSYGKMFYIDNEYTEVGGFFLPVSMVKYGEWDVILNQSDIVIGIVSHDHNPYSLEVLHKLVKRAETIQNEENIK